MPKRLSNEELDETIAILEQGGWKNNILKNDSALSICKEVRESRVIFEAIKTNPIFKAAAWGAVILNTLWHIDDEEKDGTGTDKQND